MLFLPWYLFATEQWDASIQRSEYPKFHWTLGMGMDAFKGISGGSFLCTVVFLVLVIVGIRFSTVAIKGLLLSSAVVVVVGALAIDSWRDYFFASRQFLFAVPSLSILAAIGFEGAWRRNKLMSAAVACVFLIAAITNDVRIQLNAKEDWPAAARALAQVSRDGYCVQMPESQRGSVMLYSVFVPSLLSQTCGDLTAQSRVALVSNLATEGKTLDTWEREMHQAGFNLRKTISVGGTTIEMEER